MELTLTVWLLSAAAALISALLIAGLTRRYALAHALIDSPNERSSHTTDTPRGGGVGIVVSILLATAALGIAGIIDGRLALALGVGGGAVAAIGWLDDHRHVGAGWRAMVHFLAAGWALFQLGGIPSLSIGPWTLDVGLFGVPLALLTIVWLTNLYNFMDGIDGIATTQAIFVGSAAALLLALHGAPGNALLCLLMAMACGGFLYWNWPPARLFMGDVGSGFLGYCFAVLAIAGENSGQLPLSIWLILLALFITDASYTLLARLLRGERVYEAHREHAYQHLVRRDHSHRQVTTGWSLINLLIILPLALLASCLPNVAPLLLMLLYVALWAAWRWARKTPASRNP